MSAEKKDLSYYLAHPDEMPEDPKELERLTNEHVTQSLESGQEQLTVDRFVPPDEKKDEKQGASSDAKVEEAAKPAAEAKAEEKPEGEAKAVEKKADGAAAKAEEPKPEGILAKDGKHVIPYSQLESARERAKTAEDLVKAQATEIEKLKAKPAEAVVDVAMLTEEELAVLEADSPTLAKTLRAQQAQITSMAEQLKSVTERQAEQVATEDAVVKTEIQTAIDANSTLAGWQTSEDQTMWNEASRFDKLLRESPRYANVPFADRFAKVVELTQSALGQAAEVPAKVEEAKPAPTAEETRAAAAAKLAEKNKKATPVSLSQIPGGAPPAVDERQKVEQMSAVALGNSFQGMTKDQLEAYLATL